MLTLMARPLKYLATFLLIGAFVNDVTFFDSNSFFNMPKLLFLMGSILIIFAGLKKTKPGIQEISIYFYFVSLTILGLMGEYGFSEKSAKVCISIFIGAISYSILTRISLAPKTVINIYLFWLLFSIFLGTIQALTGSFYAGDRIFESTIIPLTFRASGLMNDPNYFSLLCIIGLVMCMYQGRNNIYLYLIAFGVLISGSRAGIIMFIFIFLAGKFFRKNFFYLFSFLLVILFLGYVFKHYLPESLEMLFIPEAYLDGYTRNSLQDRFLSMSSAFHAFREFPFTGYGLGNFIYYPSNLYNQVSHNTYLELLAEVGSLGFIIYLLLIYIFFIKKIKNSSTPRKLDKFNIILLIAFSTMSLFLVTYYSRLLFLTLFLSYLITQGKYKQTIK